MTDGKHGTSRYCLRWRTLAITARRTAIHEHRAAAARRSCQVALGFRGLQPPASHRRGALDIDMGDTSLMFAQPILYIMCICTYSEFEEDAVSIAPAAGA